VLFRSSIPSGAIFELILLVFYTTAKNISLGAFDLGVTGFYPATSGTIVAGDFSTFGEANLSKYYDYINSSGLATSTWNGFYLHTDPSYGVVINPDGYTNLMLRFSWDMEESTPPWSSGIYDSFACSSMSGGNEPYLELTWHLPFEDTEPFVSGEIYHYKAVRVQSNQVSYDSKIVHHAYDGSVAECVHDATVYEWSSHNWTTLRNGSGSEAQNDPTVYGIGTGQFTSATGQDSWEYLQRSILLFDTAAIPDNAIITSGFLGAFGWYKSKSTFNRFTLNAANGGENGTILPWYARQGNETVTSDTAQYWQGSRSIKCVTPNSVSSEGIECNAYNIYPGAPSNSYTFSIYLRGNSGGETVKLVLNEYDSNYGWIDETQSTMITLTTSWVRYSVTHTYSSSGVYSGAIVMTNSQQAATFWADGAQIECGSSPTTFVLPLSVPTLSISTVDASPADPYNIVAGDYDGTTFTRMVDDIVYDDFTEWEWNFADLTTYGKSHISNVNPISMMFLSAAETDNSAPVWTPLTELLMVDRGMFPLYEVDAPPYIAVWYTIPTLQTISTSLSFTSILNAVKQGGQQLYQGVSASLGFAVSIPKALTIGRTIPANATFTPSITNIATRLRTLSANATFSVSLLKALTLGRILSANATFTVSILRMGYRTLAANVGFTVTLARFVTAYRSISASLAFAVSIVSQKTKSQTISASLAFTASIGLLKSKSVALSASLASTVTLVRGLSLGRSLSVTENATASLSILLNMYRGLSVIENASVSLSRSLSMLRTLSITEQPVPTLSRLSQLKRTISAVVSFVASLLASKEAPYPPDLLPTIYLICDTNNGASLSCDATPSVSLECDAITKTIYLICRET